MLRRIVSVLQRAGVGLLAGTDNPQASAFAAPGFSLHQELELLVGAGLTPVEALRTATVNPARYFGLEDSLGTVQSGKLADLVLLNANPLEDIRHWRLNNQRAALAFASRSSLSSAARSK